MPLLIVNHNPAAADFLVVIAVAIILVLAVFVLGVWLVVARGQARRDEREFADSAADPALRSLRRKRLVVRGRRGAGRGEPVTAQLEPVEPAPPRRRRGG